MESLLNVISHNSNWNTDCSLISAVELWVDMIQIQNRRSKILRSGTQEPLKWPCQYESRSRPVEMTGQTTHPASHLHWTSRQYLLSFLNFPFCSTFVRLPPVFTKSLHHHCIPVAHLYHYKARGEAVSGKL